MATTTDLKANFESLFLSDPNIKPPNVAGSTYLINGEIREWKGKNCPVYSPVYIKDAKDKTIIGTLASEESKPNKSYHLDFVFDLFCLLVFSFVWAWNNLPIRMKYQLSKVGLKNFVCLFVGHYPMLEPAQAVEAIEGAFNMVHLRQRWPLVAAERAYDFGRGKWPTMSPRERIGHMEKYLAGLKAKKEEIANLLMWEICKTAADATKEVDRTIQYMVDTIKALKELENGQNKCMFGWDSIDNAHELIVR